MGFVNCDQSPGPAIGQENTHHVWWPGIFHLHAHPPIDPYSPLFAPKIPHSPRIHYSLFTIHFSCSIVSILWPFYCLIEHLSIDAYAFLDSLPSTHIGILHLRTYILRHLPLINPSVSRLPDPSDLSRLQPSEPITASSFTRSLISL